MILTWFIKCAKRWFDNLIDQAIIDGADLYRVFLLRGWQIPQDAERRKNRLFVASMVLYFVLVAVATYVWAFGGAA